MMLIGYDEDGNRVFRGLERVRGLKRQREKGKETEREGRR